MSVHHATARKLATQAEWTLLEASRAREITALTPARLAQKIARARKLRDKYRDLAKQQRGEARGKRTPKSTRAAAGNANTVIKQQMFAEALERFEARLAKVTAKTTAKAKAKAPPKRVAKTTSKRITSPAPAPGPDAGFGRNPWARKATATATAKQAQSDASRGKRKAHKLTHQSAEAHQGHVGSRGRRNQAKRDGK